MGIHDFLKAKQVGRKLSMLTCYDFWSAQLLAQTEVDMLLVGDSVAMVVYGHPTTVPATTNMMVQHIQAVTKGAPLKFVVGDVPFLEHRKGLRAAIKCVQQLMQAGAHAIKLEGAAGNESLIRHIVESGVPVMGHLGLTPQSIHQLGGFKVQGKQEKAAELILEQSLLLQDLGCFSIVLECVPSELAKKITHRLEIPTIGIGAGHHTDGQVLVLQDMLGFNEQFQPKFLRQFAMGNQMIKESVMSYVSEVKNQRFPNQEESYQ